MLAAFVIKKFDSRYCKLVVKVSDCNSRAKSHKAKIELADCKTFAVKWLENPPKRLPAFFSIRASSAFLLQR